MKTKVIDDGNGNYLNDLVIEKTSLNDSANYICLAAHTISGTFNFTYKSTYLTVLPAFKLSPESSNSNDFTLPFSTIFWIFFGGISSIVMLSIGFFFFIEWIREKRNKTANNNFIERGDNIHKRDYTNINYYKNGMTSPQTPYISSNMVTNGDNCYSDNRLT